MINTTQLSWEMAHETINVYGTGTFVLGFLAGVLLCLYVFTFYLAWEGTR